MGEKHRYAKLAIAALGTRYKPCAACVVHFEFVFSPPPSWSQVRKDRIFGQPHDSKPDLSNLIKFIEDALNGIVWLDDRLIVGFTARKQYGKVPLTKVTVLDASQGTKWDFGEVPD